MDVGHFDLGSFVHCHLVAALLKLVLYSGPSLKNIWNFQLVQHAAAQVIVGRLKFV